MPAKILIVEDERITAEHLRDVITELGYSVTDVVSNGADAISRAEQTSPDLVLMDIRIQGAMDGTEVARILRHRFNIPVVYLTAHADRQTLDRAKAGEPLGYVVKPFQEAELQATIEIALHKSREDQKSRAREEWLAATLSGIGEGIISLDQNGKVSVLNPAAEAWTDWTRDDAIGRPVREVLTITDSVGCDALETRLRCVLETGAVEELGDDVFVVSRHGERRRVGGTMAPVRDHKGGVSGAVIVFGTRDRGSESAEPPAAVAAQLGEPNTAVGDFRMVAVSPAMNSILKLARRIAESEAATILLEGESGTGKDVLAQFIHHSSKYRTGPFIALNCAAIPETLLESDLFGYEKGAFTDAREQKKGLLEMATAGTIFLDEIGEMPLPLQAKLLRVLEGQSFRRLGGTRDIHVDTRVMAATNRRLSEAIERGTFRLDLYYRLNVISISLPPLRNRKEEILPLAKYFIHLYNGKFRRNIQGLSPAATRAMTDYNWPGNIRELRNRIERALLLEETDWIQRSSLQLETPDETVMPLEESLPPDATLEDVEKSMVVKALEKSRGNQSRAATLLGVSRHVLRYRIKKFNIQSTISFSSSRLPDATKTD